MKRRQFMKISAASMAAGVATPGTGLARPAEEGKEVGRDCNEPVMRMTERDLNFITGPQAQGALGSSGTGSGGGCDNTTVHCCFNGAYVSVARLRGRYTLAVGDRLFPIDIAGERREEPPRPQR